MKKIKANLALAFCIILLISCNNNGNDCITSGGDLNLQESGCLAETLTNFCNPWGCRTDPTSETIIFRFDDCTPSDCTTLECEQNTITNLQAISTSEFTTTIENELQEEFACVILVP